MLHLFKTNRLGFIVVPYLMPVLSKVQRCKRLRDGWRNGIDSGKHGAIK